MNSKRKNLTPEHEQLYNTLDFGKQNGQSKTLLQIRTGFSERRIRKLIEELSTNGLVVCNDQDGKGYYKPDTVEDFETYIKIETSRANALRRKVYGIKSALNEFLIEHKETLADEEKSISELN